MSLSNTGGFSLWGRLFHSCYKLQEHHDLTGIVGKKAEGSLGKQQVNCIFSCLRLEGIERNPL